MDIFSQPQFPVADPSVLAPNDLDPGFPTEAAQPTSLPSLDFDFGSGIFTVGDSGQVAVDFLVDGGAYAGELALFSLSEIKSASVEDLEDFAREAARLALSDSLLGRVVISDASQGAKYDPLLGEAQSWNRGAYLGAQTFEFNPGDTLGLMLMPDGTLADFLANPRPKGNQQPLFSMATVNPGGHFQLGQIADINGEGHTFVMEDMGLNGRSDRDYDDLIFQISGVEAHVAALDDHIAPENDWRDTPAGQELIDHVNLPTEPTTGVKYKPHELLLKFPVGATDADIALILSNYDSVTQIDRIVLPTQQPNSPLQQWRLVRFQANTDLLAQQARFAQDSRITATDLNVVLSIAANPNDTAFSQQWGLHNTGQTEGLPDADIDAPAAWDVSIGSSDVVVAVLDTGIDYEHPDLRANRWVNELEANGLPFFDDDGNGYVDDVYGYDFSYGNVTPSATGVFPPGDTPRDTHNHGTHVAGIIGAVGNNNRGISGVSPNVSLMPVQMLSDWMGTGTVVEAALAINYATANGADIINASFGGYLDGWGRFVMADAIQTALNQDVLVVTAAGNHTLEGLGGDGNQNGAGGNNDVRPFYPASFDAPNLLSVAATNAQDELATFSNYGATSVHLGAPGAKIWSTLPSARKESNSAVWKPEKNEDHYGFNSGTSMAAPHVTGAAALMLAVNPNLTANQLKNLLMTTVDPLATLQGKTVTGGRLNLAKALAAAQETPPELIRIAPITGANADQPFTIRHQDLFDNTNLATQGYTPAEIQFRVEGLGEDAPTQGGQPVPTWTTVLAAGDELEWTSTIDGNAITAFTVTAMHGNAVSANPVPVQVDVLQSVVSVEATTPDALEGGSAGAFTITRTGNIDQPLAVTYVVETETRYWPAPPATMGADYEPLSGTLTIPAGATSAILPIVPIDDEAIEWPERVNLLLMEGIGYEVDENSRDIVTIWDNEKPRVQVDSEA